MRFTHEDLNDHVYRQLKRSSPTVAELIRLETERQRKTVELIASENFPSEAIRIAMAGPLTCKYTEGYPAVRESGKTGRYYGGCQYYDELEEYCCSEWKKVFNTDYHVNVQPHSGASSNLAAYMSVLKFGDTILALDLNNGGHLTHGSKANFSGNYFNVIPYGLDDKGYIDMDDVEFKAAKHHPKLIVAGASAYSREIDFKYFHEIADRHNAMFMVDMAHIAGLIATGNHNSPFGLADIITTTTHKTLRGPRGGMIFCKPELANKVDFAVFPYCQGGPLQHVIAAKAICAEEAQTDEYNKYIEQVVFNAWSMAREFQRLGYEVVSGGTDNHMFLLDFSNTHPWLTGKQLQDVLDEHFITLNKNCVPNEKRSPTQASGVRIGTPAMTTLGYKDKEFEKVADKIDKIIGEIPH